VRAASLSDPQGSHKTTASPIECAYIVPTGDGESKDWSKMR